VIEAPVGSTTAATVLSGLMGTDASNRLTGFSGLPFVRFR
jgi:hypothetical protein